MKNIAFFLLAAFAWSADAQEQNSEKLVWPVSEADAFAMRLQTETSYRDCVAKSAINLRHSTASASEVADAAIIECNKEFGDLGLAIIDEAMSQQASGKLTAREASAMIESEDKKVRSQARDRAFVDTIKARSTAQRTSSSSASK